MALKKSFPLQAESGYTQWKEVALSAEEEKGVEEDARRELIELYGACIDDAKHILLDKGMKAFDPNILQVAGSLFEKRASHVVYHKEEKAKEKFDSL